MPNVVLNEHGEVWNDTIHWPIMEMFYKIMENPEEYNKYIGARSLGEFFSKAMDYESQNETQAFKEKVKVMKDLGNR